MSRGLRIAGILLAVVLAAAWTAPALLTPSFAARGAEEAGVSVNLATVWPAWPFGIATSELTVTQGFQRLELSDVRLTWSPGLFRQMGWHLDATLGGGSVRAFAQTLGESGTLELENVDASALPRPRPEVLMVGTASGDARWGQTASEIRARIQNGSLSIPLVIALPFDALELDAAFTADGAATIERLAADGPELVARVEGEISASQQLVLGAVIERLGSELRGSLERLGVAVPEAPVAYAISGSLQVPVTREVSLP
jgi:hypothetical protein